MLHSRFCVRYSAAAAAGTPEAVPQLSLLTLLRYNLCQDLFYCFLSTAAAMMENVSVRHCWQQQQQRCDCCWPVQQSMIIILVMTQLSR